MLHILPNPRIAAYNAGVRNKSYGCINATPEILEYMSKNYAGNDSLYSIPVKEGNYIYESNEEGHPLKTNYSNAPATVSGKHYATSYVDLPLTYNTGY